MIETNKRFAELVYNIVAQIPEGRVMTYGQIAGMCGNARASRIVGGIAHFGPSDLPWHRVVNKQGGLASGYHGGRRAQKEHLEAEGVAVRGEEGNYNVDIAELLWSPNVGTKYEARSTKLELQPFTLHPSPFTLFIVGPTASGKSGLAIEVARKFNGEIICADSQTIKRGLDIGTAKPTNQDQAEVKHHLIDIVEPYEPFSVAEFKSRAELAIEDIKNRGKMPVVVGGSGLYIDALLYNFEFRPTTTGTSRDELNKKSVSELQKMITDKGLDLPRNEDNPRHLIRTIESEGVKSQKGTIREGSVVIGIDPDKEVLEQRIIDRVNLMFEVGLVDETKVIMAKHGRVPGRFDAIGYLVVQRLLDGEISEEEARNLLVIAHRQYAKKQRSWFSRNSDIEWFETAKEAFEYIKKLI